MEHSTVSERRIGPHIQTQLVIAILQLVSRITINFRRLEPVATKLYHISNEAVLRLNIDNIFQGHVDQPNKLFTASNMMTEEN